MTQEAQAQPRVLILGASGLLGYHCVQKFKQNHQVLGTVCSRAPQSISEVHFDIESNDSLREILESFRPDAIINTIGFVTVDGCQQQPDKAHLLNVEFVRQLVTIMDTIGLTDSHLVQISSDSVYGCLPGNKQQKYRPWCEDDPVNPLSAYAETKYLGELEALKHTGPVSILRTAFYGINPNSKKSLLWWIIDNALNGREMDGWENIYFNPLSATDLVEVINDMLLKKVEGVFNVGSTDACNKYDFVESVCVALDIQTKLNRVSSNFNEMSTIRPHYSVVGVDQLYKALSWKRSWHDSLLAYLSNMPPFPK